MKETALVPVDQMQVMAAAVAKSGLFGMKSADQALALMLIAQAEGLHPAIAARDYHIIQGRPALKSDAMLARFQAAGGRVEWKEYTDKRVAAVFSHPSGGTVEIDWTFERAKAANLTGKDTWRQYPRQMLRARVISEGIRTIYPGVSVGMYTPEEVQDFEPVSEPKDITPPASTGSEAKPVVETPKAKPQQTDKVCNPNQASMIRAKLANAKIEESRLCKHYKVDSVDVLPFSLVNDALKLISSGAVPEDAEIVEEACPVCDGIKGFCGCEAAANG